jgi:hypothetical protein
MLSGVEGFVNMYIYIALNEPPSYTRVLGRLGVAFVNLIMGRLAYPHDERIDGIEGEDLGTGSSSGLALSWRTVARERVCRPLLAEREHGGDGG